MGATPAGNMGFPATPFLQLVFLTLIHPALSRTLTIPSPNTVLTMGKAGHVRTLDTVVWSVDYCKAKEEKLKDAAKVAGKANATLAKTGGQK